MSAKKLEAGSKYSKIDLDGDGVITDSEMEVSERMVHLDNENRMADQQRLMAWAAMIFVMAVVAVQYTPIVPLERIEATMGFVNTVVVAMLGVVATFMAVNVIKNSKK